MELKDLNSENHRQTKQLISYLVSNDSGYALRESNLHAAFSSAQSFGQSNLVAAFLYLNCLDQIGDLFCEPNGKGKNNDNAIKKALEKFGPKLSQKKLHGLVNLRHALAHKMGLVNIKGNSNCKYIVSYDETSNEVIVPPQKIWNGKFEQGLPEIFSAKFDTKTSYVVNVFALRQMVQGVFNTIESQKDSLIFYLESNPQETTKCWNERYQTRLREIAYRFFVYYKEL